MGLGSLDPGLDQRQDGERDTTGQGEGRFQFRQQQQRPEEHQAGDRGNQHRHWSSRSGLPAIRATARSPTRLHADDFVIAGGRPGGNEPEIRVQSPVDDLIDSLGLEQRHGVTFDLLAGDARRDRLAIPVTRNREDLDRLPNRRPDRIRDVVFRHRALEIRQGFHVQRENSAGTLEPGAGERLISPGARIASGVISHTERNFTIEMLCRTCRHVGSQSGGDNPLIGVFTDPPEVASLEGAFEVALEVARRPD